MELSVSELTSTRKEIQYNIEAAEIRNLDQSVLSDFRREARIPGFRPGKAPDAMIRKRYAAQIRDEIRKRLYNEAYQEATRTEGLTILSIVEMKEPEAVLDGSTDATMSVVVDILPHFPTPVYKGIPVKIGPTEASAIEIQEAIDNLRRQHADFVVAEKAAEAGDFVKCSYNGTIEGQPVAEIAPHNPIFGTQENTWEQAGAEEEPGVPAIVAALVGMAAGDTREVEQSFAEDHPVEALRRKTATYKVEVHEVRERQLPELNDEFAATLGLESAEKLRESVSSQIVSQKENRNANLKRRQVLDVLERSVQFDIPESSIDTRRDSILQEYIGRQLSQGGTEEELEKRKDELFHGAEAAARNRAKLDFILGRIAREEKVEVSNEDFGNYIYNRAMQSRERPEKIVSELKKNRAEVDEIRRNLLISKTIDLVVEHSLPSGVTEEEVASILGNPPA